MLNPINLNAVSDSTYREQEELLFRTTARLKGVFFYRLLIMLMLVGTALFYPLPVVHTSSYLFVIVALIALNVLHVYLGYLGKDCRFSPLWVAAGEILGFTLLADFTGGLGSFFVYFYFLLQLHTATWFNRKLSWQTGGMCTSAVLLLYATEPGAELSRVTALIIAMISMSLGTGEIASLVSRARERVVRAAADLIKANREVLSKRDELLESETRLRRVLDTAAEGIFGVDVNGNCIFANQSCIRMLGYNSETDLLGKNMHALAHHSYPDGTPYPMATCRIARASRDGESAHSDEEVHWRADGTSFPAEYWSHPIISNGTLVGTVVSFIDITERRKNESTIKERIKLFELQKNILAELPMLPQVLNGDILYVARWVTEQCVEVLQVERASVWLFDEEKSNLYCIDLYLKSKQSHMPSPPLSKGVFQQEFDHLQTSKYIDSDDPYNDPRTRSISGSYLRPLGITSLLDVSIQAGGEFFGIIGFEHVGVAHSWNQDEINFANQISDQLALTLMHGIRMRAEDALRELNTDLEERVTKRTQQLENSNQQLQEALGILKRAQDELVRSEKLASLGSLVAGVAHELNTPLGNSVTVATSFAEKLLRFRTEVESGSLTRSGMSEFIEQSQLAAQLLSNNLSKASELISHFKQVAVDQTSVQRRTFNLREMLDEVVMALQPQMKSSRHKLWVTMQDDIELDSYPGPLGQVIINLVSNALMHGLTDEVKEGSIHIEAEKQGDFVKLSVSDNGAGIPDEIQAKIFDPFFTTKLGQGGSGLGLHIVYSIVTRVLGGEIRLFSEPGEGASFVMDLPLMAPENTVTSEESYQTAQVGQ